MLFFKSASYEKHTNITNNQINMKMTDLMIYQLGVKLITYK